MDELNGKAALVTGGSRGIGAAVATALAARGADVALTYVDNSAAAAAVVDRVEGMGRRAMALRADSADPTEVVEAVRRAARTFGGLDILVNNAAAFHAGELGDVGVTEVDHLLAVNVRAPYLAARAAAEHMTAGGRIITIGSNVAERVPFPGLTAYSMSKAALVGLTKGLARDLGPRGITAVLVNPGPTDTAMNPADGPAADAIRGFTALGRYAEPDEIAATVAHLAGVGYLTGTAVHVDGGFTA